MTKEEILRKITHTRKTRDAIKSKSEIYEAMDEYTKQQVVEFIKFIQNPIEDGVIGYVYGWENKWQVIEPCRFPKERRYLSTEELYQLFMTTKRIDLQEAINNIEIKTYIH